VKLNPADHLRADHIPEPGSIPVTLGDGQDWLVPKPYLVQVLADDEVGYFFRSETGDEVFDGALNDALQEWERGDGRGRLSAESRIFRIMLRRNYDLTGEQVSAVLRFRVSRDELDPAKQALLEIAQGLTGPKPGAGGGGSP
jgi:hypothetical protein